MSREVFEKLSQFVIDSKRPIEIGWFTLRKMAVHPGASELQISEMRKAFFCGAHHLFSLLMNALEPGVDPTEADLSRVELIQAELEMFIAELEEQTKRPKYEA